MIALIIAAIILIVVVGALLWWRIDKMDKRVRQQIDSYGATVGELVDYVNGKLDKEN